MSKKKKDDLNEAPRPKYAGKTAGTLLHISEGYDMRKKVLISALEEAVAAAAIQDVQYAPKRPERGQKNVGGKGGGTGGPPSPLKAKRPVASRPTMTMVGKVDKLMRKVAAKEEQEYKQGQERSYESKARPKKNKKKGKRKDSNQSDGAMDHVVPSLGPSVLDIVDDKISYIRQGKKREERIGPKLSRPPGDAPPKHHNLASARRKMLVDQVHDQSGSMHRVHHGSVLSSLTMSEVILSAEEGLGSAFVPGGVLEGSTITQNSLFKNPNMQRGLEASREEVTKDKKKMAKKKAKKIQQLERKGEKRPRNDTKGKKKRAESRPKTPMEQRVEKIKGLVIPAKPTIMPVDMTSLEDRQHAAAQKIWCEAFPDATSPEDHWMLTYEDPQTYDDFVFGREPSLGTVSQGTVNSYGTMQLINGWPARFTKQNVGKVPTGLSGAAAKREGAIRLVETKRIAIQFENWVDDLDRWKRQAANRLEFLYDPDWVCHSLTHSHTHTHTHTHTIPRCSN